MKNHPCYQIDKMPRVKSFVLSPQTRAMVKRVLDMCEQEAADKELGIPLSRPLDRTAALTGIGKRTVQRIKRVQPPSPKKRKVRKDKLILDDFDICLIRRLICNMYMARNQLPTIKTIREELQRTIEAEKPLENSSRNLDSSGLNVHLTESF